jgi:hypothetical protein
MLMTSKEATMTKRFFTFVLLLGIIASFALGCSPTAEETTNNHCTGESCNDTTIINPPDPVDNCPVGQDPVIVCHDDDNDGKAEVGPTATLCLGSTADVPPGWTINCGDPDPCPGDPLNVCGITAPSLQIEAVVSGHTVTVNAYPLYANGYTTQIRFFWGVVSENQWVDTSANGGWNYTWTNVAAGTYIVSAQMWTNDGKTATSNNVTVTIVDTTPVCAPTLRCSWAYDEPASVNFFSGISTSCYASWFNQPPDWQWSTFRTCHDPSNGCVIDDEAYATALNNGRCEFNVHAPEYLNGNPANPFGTSEMDFRNWALTPNGSGGAYNALATGYPQCYLNADCTDYVEVPVVYICHEWGCNYLVDFTGSVDTQTGNTVNVFVHTYVDSDADGYPNQCPTGDANCVPDNCLRYANPIQSVNPCLTGPNPDVDNDWFITGSGVPTQEYDNYSTDRTRH